MSKLFMFLEKLPDWKQQAFKNSLVAEWTHTSTALEGNTFSIGDTEFFLQQGLTVAGKTLKEHCEIKGHAQAIEHLETIITEKLSINCEDLWTLHRMIQLNPTIDLYNPVGAWKKEINGTYMRDKQDNMVFIEYPHPDRISSLMNLWLDKFNSVPINSYTKEQAVDLFAELHTTFVSIHPFADGNGRMARLVSNLPLLASGLPPLLIPKEVRREYIQLIGQHQQLAPLEKDDLAFVKTKPYLDFIKLCQKSWDTTWQIFNNLA